MPWRMRCSSGFAKQMIAKPKELDSGYLLMSAKPKELANWLIEIANLI